jgi:hypothetical protein
MREGVHEGLGGTCCDPQNDQECKNKKDQNQGTDPVEPVRP